MSRGISADFGHREITTNGLGLLVHRCQVRAGRPAEKALIVSGFLVLRLDVLNLGSVTGVLQHPAQVDDLLRVDVLVVGTFERLGLSSEGHKEPTGTVLLDRSHSIQ